MIDLKLLREHPEVVAKAIRNRGWSVDLEAVQKIDTAYRETLQQVETLRAAQNQSSGPIDETRRAAKRTVKAELKEAEEKLKELERTREALLRDLPNIPQADVPVGPDESGNLVLRTVGTPAQFSFSPQDYLTLAAEHDLLDLERASKVSGARFAYFKGAGALLNLALVRYGFDIAVRAGFTPILPPVLIGEEAMASMGYLDYGGEEETYHFAKDRLYLVGTSEQAIGPLHMGEILDANRLPLRYVAFSTCFRREAGSYGKDTKGILRVHQFDKVEMFSFTTPEQADEEHQHLVALQERFMSGLKLPYRVVALCTGELSGPSARTYDIETWIPSQGKYRETHSTSTTTDFQSRRLRIRYRTSSGDTALVHCLNGTMVAVNRPFIAILENYQQADGTIAIPLVLQPYFGKPVIG